MNQNLSRISRAYARINESRYSAYDNEDGEIEIIADWDEDQNSRALAGIDVDARGRKWKLSGLKYVLIEYLMDVKGYTLNTVKSEFPELFQAN